jgi:hypothetical protein
MKILRVSLISISIFAIFCDNPFIYANDKKTTSKETSKIDCLSGYTPLSTSWGIMCTPPDDMHIPKPTVSYIPSHAFWTPHIRIPKDYQEDIKTELTANLQEDVDSGFITNTSKETGDFEVLFVENDIDLYTDTNPDSSNSLSQDTSNPAPALTIRYLNNSVNDLYFLESNLVALFVYREISMENPCYNERLRRTSQDEKLILCRILENDPEKGTRLFVIFRYPVMVIPDREIYSSEGV